MKIALSILLLTYYSIGVFLLPLGNFAVLQDVPEMYQHCKTYEDKDMTVVDFFTDHLINIDGVFDKHTNGDEQKPHQPIHHHHSVLITAPPKTVYLIKTTPFFTKKKLHFSPKFQFILSGFNTDVFRPPIVG